MYVWMDGWMDGGWMHACMHVCMYVCVSTEHFKDRPNMANDFNLSTDPLGRRMIAKRLKAGAGDKHRKEGFGKKLIKQQLWIYQKYMKLPRGLW